MFHQLIHRGSLLVAVGLLALGATFFMGLRGMARGTRIVAARTQLTRLPTASRAGRVPIGHRPAAEIAMSPVIAARSRRRMV
jgi:hypothetical protein